MMKKFFMALALSFLMFTSTEATFLLTDGNEMRGVKTNYIALPEFHNAFLLTQAQLQQDLFQELRDQGISAHYLPQTCWDLFSTLQMYKSSYSLADSPGITRDWQKLNNGFIDYLRQHPDRLDAFKKARFDDIVSHLSHDIQKHLKRYHTEVQALCGTEKNSKFRKSYEDVKIWLYADTHFPELTRVLARAAMIEAECYAKDELPLWRHSRLKISFAVDKDTSVKLVDMPLSYNDRKQKVTVGCLSYAYSLLSCYAADSTMLTIGDYNYASACTMIYFMQEIRDHLYTQNKLPFYTTSYFTPEEAVEKLREASCLLVVKMPKTSINIYKFPLRAVTNPKTPWFMPTLSPYEWLYQAGEKSHPRRFGNILTRDDEGLLKFTDPLDTEALDPVSIARDISKDMQNAELLSFGGKIDCETIHQAKEKIVQDYKAFESMLDSTHNPQALIQNQFQRKK